MDALKALIVEHFGSVGSLLLVVFGAAFTLLAIVVAAKAAIRWLGYAGRDRGSERDWYNEPEWLDDI
jgi:hypothetical protein